MKKRVFSLLLALVMVVGLLPVTASAADTYDLWVGGVQVTSDNKADLAAGNANVTGTVSYDSTTNTLTLNGANIGGATSGGSVASLRGICSGIAGGLTIRLVGENTVTGGVESNKSYGISADTDLTITGDGTLNVRGKDSTDEQRLYASVGIYVSDANVTITGGTVNAAGGATNNSSISGGESYGIWRYKFTGTSNLTVSGGTLNATGGACTNGSSTTSPSFSCGIRGADSGSITISGGTVTATGGAVTSEGSNVCNSYGIATKGTATFSGGTVTATGGTYTNNTSSASCGISAYTLTFSGSTNVTASGEMRGIEYTPNTVDSGLAIKASTNKDGSSPTAYNAANFENYKYLYIAPPTHSHAVSVDCSESEGTQVTFTAWNSATSLPTTAGSYYLDTDVTLPTLWQLTSAQNIKLCLNGHTIKTEDSSQSDPIDLSGNVVLSICDCQPEQGAIIAGSGNILGLVEMYNATFNLYGGKLTGGNGTSIYYGTPAGGVMVNDNNGTFNMYGGEISGNTGTYAGGVRVNAGTFNMFGGEIKNNTVTGENENGGGVCIAGGFMNVGGTAKITGNKKGTADNNVYLPTGKTITVSAPLTIGASIGVTTQTAPTEGSPVDITWYDNADYSGFFASDNSDYQIVNTGTGSSQVVKLALPVPHKHAVSVDCATDEGTQVTFEELTLDKLSSLTYVDGSGDINSSHNFYLADDLDISTKKFRVYSSGVVVNLCLNGHKLTGKSLVLFSGGVTLNICDCSDDHLSGQITAAPSGSWNMNDYSAYDYNGLQVGSGSTANLYGGTITGNRDTQGAGVYNAGTFIMHGGAITNNTAWQMGGGIYNEGTLELKGGTIIGNTADINQGEYRGGGVYQSPYSGSISASGAPIVKNNTLYPGGDSINNVYLPTGKTITVSAPLTTDAAIGITTQTAPTDGNPVAITGANGDDYSKFFASDSSDYVIVNTGSGSDQAVKLQVAAPTTYTVSFNSNGGSGTMSAVAVPAGAYTLPECDFTAPDGKQFKGWATSASATTVLDSYTVSGDVTLYAIWEDIPVVKADQTITASDVSATYGDTGKKIKVTGKTYGALSYTVKSGTSATVDASGNLTILSAGDTVITITAAGDATHNSATKDVTVSVAKATVTVAAKNQSIYVNGTVPDLTTPVKDTHYTVTGLAGSDALTGTLVLAYEKSGSPATPDNTTTGTYDIVVSGVTEPNANYNAIVLTNGTLTISTKPSGGGGTPTVTVPVSGDAGSVNVKVTVSGTTASVDTVTAADLKKVVNAATEPVNVVIDMTGLGKTIDAATLTNSTLKAIADAANEDGSGITGLEVKLSGGTVVLEDKPLAAIQEQAGSDSVTLAVKPAAVADLNVKQKPVVEKLKAPAVFDVYFLVGSKRVESLSGGKIKITVPYVLTKGAVVVNYVDDAGKLEKLACTYDTATKAVSFETTHNSYYVISADADPCVNFTDINRDLWYHGAIDYAIENSLMNGVGGGKFNPNGNLSRAMLCQIFYNKEGRPAVTAENPFTDVPADQWYTDAVIWAYENKIVEGYDNGKFGPNDDITREQLAAIIWRYDGKKDSAASLDAFSDAGKISNYALGALKWAVENKVVSGKGGGILDPRGKATRAEVAQMLMNYLKK